MGRGKKKKGGGGNNKMDAIIWRIPLVEEGRCAIIYAAVVGAGTV